MMKYKIIPDDIVKNVIEFLDEIQFEAATGNKPDDLQRINFCNWIISELMNGLDGFDLPSHNDEDDEHTGDLIDRWDKIRIERNGFALKLTELQDRVKELETDLYFCNRNNRIGEIVDERTKVETR